MSKRLLPILAILLTAATAAHAQYGGGGPGSGGMGGGRGHGGGHGRRPQSPDSAPAERHQERIAPETPLSKIEIVGVVQAIDPVSERITIAYEPVEALDWPAGANAFAVSKTALLKVAAVGEKVRFHVESQQITALEPYVTQTKPPWETDDSSGRGQSWRRGEDETGHDRRAR